MDFIGEVLNACGMGYTSRTRKRRKLKSRGGHRLVLVHSPTRATGRKRGRKTRRKSRRR